MDTDTGQSHLEHYSKLAKLRKSNPAFYKGTFYDLYRYTSQKVIVYGYKDESINNNDDQVVVVANFSSLERTIENVPFLSSGNWHDALNPINVITVDEDNYYNEYSIPAKSAVVFTNRDYQLTIPSSNELVPDQFEIVACYPNPFNGKTNFVFQLKNDSEIKLSIYDLNGKLIKVINNYKDRGLNELRWNGRNEMDQEISSGIYLYILNADGKTSSNKLIFLK